MNHVPRPTTPDGQTTLRKRTGAWWAQFSGEHGWLGRRIHDVVTAPAHGWRLMATWIKATLIVLAALGALLLTWWTLNTAIDRAHSFNGSTEITGLLATLSQPVRDYLTAHTVGLPVSAATAYVAWQMVGVFSFSLSWIFRAAGARLTWTAFGAATAVMVWCGTPAPGRTVATGLAVLAWTAASTLALRGLSLRPVSATHIHNQAPPVPEVRFEIHLPKQQKTALLAPFDPAKHRPPLN